MTSGSVTVQQKLFLHNPQHHSYDFNCSMHLFHTFLVYQALYNAEPPACRLCLWTCACMTQCVPVWERLEDWRRAVGWRHCRSLQVRVGLMWSPYPVRPPEHPGRPRSASRSAMSPPGCYSNSVVRLSCKEWKKTEPTLQRVCVRGIAQFSRVCVCLASFFLPRVFFSCQHITFLFSPLPVPDLGLTSETYPTPKLALLWDAWIGKRVIFMW